MCKYFCTKSCSLASNVSPQSAAVVPVMQCVHRPVTSQVTVTGTTESEIYINRWTTPQDQSHTQRWTET